MKYEKQNKKQREEKKKKESKQKVQLYCWRASNVLEHIIVRVLVEKDEEKIHWAYINSWLHFVRILALANYCIH